jgi:hypothetical protein
MAAPVNFVLESLNSEVTMGVLGNLFSESTPILDVSATAILYVSIDAMKDLFQYQTDSNELDNLPTADIKYYVDATALPPLNPVNAMMDNTDSANAISLIGTGGANLAPNKAMVCHDFTRYLASKLFGTHFGVDLFNNETELLQDIRLICDDSAADHTWFDIVTKVTKVSKIGDHADIAEDAEGDKYMTNATNDNTNLCRVLFNQLIASDISRFKDITNADAAYDGSVPHPLPFLVNDSISFKLTILPIEEQELLTGVEAFGGRSYEIKLIMVEEADVDNTEVDNLEVEPA